MEGLGNADSGLDRDCIRMTRRDVQYDATALLPGFGNVHDHEDGFPMSLPALLPRFPASERRAKAWPRSAKARSFSSTIRLTLPASKCPSSPRSPALIPVNISTP